MAWLCIYCFSTHLLKAIATDLLKNASKPRNVAILEDKIDHIGNYLIEETSLQEDKSLERNERQKKTLLQKVNTFNLLLTWKHIILVSHNICTETDWWKRYEVEKCNFEGNRKQQSWDATVKT